MQSEQSTKKHVKFWISPVSHAASRKKILAVLLRTHAKRRAAEHAVSKISSHISSRTKCNDYYYTTASINSPPLPLLDLPTERRIHFGWQCSSSRIFCYWNIGENVFDAVVFNNGIHFPFFSLSVAVRDSVHLYYILLFLYIFRRCLGFVRRMKATEPSTS